MKKETMKRGLLVVALCGLCGSVRSADIRGDGVTLDSPAIQRAIDEMSARGGGVVLLPKGVYLCGTILLKDGVTLDLAEGAVILGSTNASDYARMDGVWFMRGSTFALVGATNAVNVGLTGKGVIDGRGEGFPGPRTTYSDFARWEKQGGFGVRPRLVQFYRTRGIRVEGVRMRQSASWTFFLRECEDVVVRGIQIRSHAYFCNDGIDIEAKRVLIEDCDIDANDDAICPKSHNPDFCVEDVEVRNCRIASNCSAIKFGTKNRGGFRNFNIHHCTIIPSSEDDPIAVSSRRWTDKKTGRVCYDSYGRTDWRYGLEGIAVECVDAGFCENIHIHDLTIEGMMCPFFVRVGLREPPRHEGASIRNVLIEDIRATKEGPEACSVTGVPGRRVQGVTFRNITLMSKGLPARFRSRLEKPVPEMEGAYPQYSMFKHPLPAWGFYLRHADGIRFENVTMRLMAGESDERPAFFEDDAMATVWAPDMTGAAPGSPR